VLDLNAETEQDDGGDDSTYLTEGLDPTWSPDGSQIAFHHHGDIYRIDADGSNRTRLTRDSGWNQSPAWSPDGQHIAFVSSRNHEGSENVYEVHNSEVYIMDTDGSNSRRLTVSQTKNRTPAWSPDGQYIVYYSADGPDEAVIHVLNLADALADPENSSVSLTEAAKYDYDPVWSPDGQWIAFSSNREGLADGNINHMAIYLVAVSGGELKRLTTSDLRVSQPAWSPDGQWLTFSVKSEDDLGDIYIMRLDGSELRCLTCKRE
jgi:TolB protein